MTYFDDSGQYQLINSVAEDYVIYNAKEEKVYKWFCIILYTKRRKIYMITNPNKKEIAYAILDIKTTHLLNIKILRVLIIVQKNIN